MVRLALISRESLCAGDNTALSIILLTNKKLVSNTVFRKFLAKKPYPKPRLLYCTLRLFFGQHLVFKNAKCKLRPYFEKTHFGDHAYTYISLVRL
jgi:hypothetical protein